MTTTPASGKLDKVQCDKNATTSAPISSSSNSFSSGSLSPRSVTVVDASRLEEELPKRLYQALERADVADETDGFHLECSKFLKYTKAPSGFFKEAVATSKPIAKFTYTNAFHPGNCDYMQDRGLVTEIRLANGMVIPIAAIFDGHGPDPAGTKITDWVQANLPKYIQKHLSSCKEMSYEEIEKALIAAFLEANQALKAVKGSDRVGCTASVALIIEGKLWTANVGDSKIVFAVCGTRLTLTHEARVDDPYFTERAKKLGAKFWKSDAGGWYLDGNKKLGMATSFGDFGVVHECVPTITCLPLDPSAGYLFVGSDGFWDIFASQYLTALSKKITPTAPDLVYTAIQGVKQFRKTQGSGEGRIDNIGLIVLDFNAPGQGSPDEPPFAMGARPSSSPDEEEEEDEFFTPPSTSPF